MAGEARSPGFRLAIDCGAMWTRAAIAWSGGQGRLVTFDGVAGLPSGVLVRADGTVVAGVAAVAAQEAGWVLAAPSRRLADGLVTVADGVAVEPVEAVAAALRRVWDEATVVAGQVPDSVGLVVPATWGPRRGMLLRQAARRGGLGDVALVSAPVAVVRWLVASGVDLPPGGWLALCDIGVDCAVSVVGRTADGVEVLSMTDAAVGGDRLDEALTDHLLTVAIGAVGAQFPAGFSVAQVDRCAAVAPVRVTKEALTTASTTVVALPPPLPPVVVGARELATAVEPVAAMVAAKCREAIEAAMVEPAAGVGVFLAGGSALSPVVVEGLQRALADVGGVWVVPRPEVAAVLGGAGVSREVDGGRPPVPVSELPTVSPGDRVGGTGGSGAGAGGAVLRHDDRAAGKSADDAGVRAGQLG